MMSFLGTYLKSANAKKLVGMLAGLMAAYSVYGSDARVTPVDKRIELIEQSDYYLDMKEADWESRLDALVYPFSFAEPEPEVAKEADPGMAEMTPEPEPEPELSDRNVLEMVVPEINATGMIERGGASFIIVRGSQLPEGGAIKINIRNKPYTIFVEDISKTGFTLRLNDVVARKTYGHTSSGGIVIDAN